MTNAINNGEIFFYDEQTKKYILQFMAIFSHLQVQFGKKGDREERLVPVHLTYGFKDRVVAHIVGEHTQNKPLRLPAMAAALINMNYAADRKKGQDVERRFNYLPRGGMLPDDITTVDQKMPVPYDLDMELSIFTTNLDEYFQIMEQIMVLFNPQLDIQRSDDPFDWTRISSVQLQGINTEFNYPAGPERRIIVGTLQFTVQAYFAVPAKIRQDYIKSIQLRVGAVNSFEGNSRDILNRLDDNGETYTNIFDFQGLDTDEGN